MKSPAQLITDVNCAGVSLLHQARASISGEICAAVVAQALASTEGVRSRNRQRSVAAV
jgi:hypothetical protein